MTKFFVFDTNSLISSFLAPHSTNKKALDRTLSIGEVICSESTLNEFVHTFVRPKFDRYIPLEKRFVATQVFALKATHVNISTTITDCRDPKDNKFLELAIDGHATCIVTGDKDLLVLNQFKNIPIITPAEFLERY